MRVNLQFYRRNRNTFNEDGHKALRSRYSWEGEGRYAAIEDKISAIEGCILDVSKKFTFNTLACDLGLSSDELEAFLAFLSDPEECNLLEKLKEHIYTVPRIQESLAIAMKEREAARDRYNERYGNNSSSETSAEKPETSAENCQTSGEKIYKLNETKQNKTKLKDININNNIDNDNDIDIYVEKVKKVLSVRKDFKLVFEEKEIRVIAVYLHKNNLDISYIDFVLKIMTENGKTKPIKNPKRYFETVFLSQENITNFLNYRNDPQNAPRAAPPKKCDECNSDFYNYSTESTGKYTGQSKELLCEKCGVFLYYDHGQNKWVKDNKLRRKIPCKDEDPDLIENLI